MIKDTVSHRTSDLQNDHAPYLCIYCNNKAKGDKGCWEFSVAECRKYHLQVFSFVNMLACSNRGEMEGVPPTL